MVNNNSHNSFFIRMRSVCYSLSGRVKKEDLDNLTLDSSLEINILASFKMIKMR
jgi:hypothetical protein